MNTLQTRILSFWLLALVLILLSGCAEQQQQSAEYLQVKRGNPPEIIAVNGKAKTIPAGFIKKRLRLVIPSIENFIINDREYIYITEKWFNEVIKFTEEFIALEVPDLNLDQHYPIAYDETFAALATNFANIAVARRHNLRASVLIGFIHAKNKNPWGKIPADGGSRLYLVGLTEKDGIIYDIQTKQSIAFERFPNKDFIKGVIF